MLDRFGRTEADERGFTMVELMIVVLILGVLMAIATPMFLGARDRAQNRAAQADLRNAMTTAKTLYSDGSSYACATGTAAVAPCTQSLVSVEPTMCYTAEATPSTLGGACDTGAGEPANVSISASATTWAAARISPTGVCFAIRDTDTGGQRYGQTTNAANCTGAWAAANATNQSWS